MEGCCYGLRMNRFRQRIASDIPFARDDAHRLLPIMIACLVGFVALLFSVAMSINHALADQSSEVIGVLQVEIPRGASDNKTLTNAVVAELKQTAGVKDVAVLSTPQMEALLKPWLGQNFSLDDLPVPVILDVKTAVAGQKSLVDTESLRHTLTRLDTNIRVEDRGPWVAQMAAATTLVQALIVFIAALLMLCVIGMIILVAKTNLRLHFKAVSLLHMFGATDEYILRQFQWNSAWLAARGAMAGVLFAALIFATAVILSMRWHSPVLPEIHMSFMHAIMFLMLPLLTAVISWIATRLTVQSMLHRMH